MHHKLSIRMPFSFRLSANKNMPDGYVAGFKRHNPEPEDGCATNTAYNNTLRIFSIYVLLIASELRSACWAASGPGYCVLFGESPTKNISQFLADRWLKPLMNWGPTILLKRHHPIHKRNQSITVVPDTLYSHG